MFDLVSPYRVVDHEGEAWDEKPVGCLEAHVVCHDSIKERYDCISAESHHKEGRAEGCPFSEATDSQRPDTGIYE